MKYMLRSTFILMEWFSGCFDLFLFQNISMRIKISMILAITVFVFTVAMGQKVNWTSDGLYYTRLKDGNMIRVDPKTESETILFKRESLIPSGATEPLKVQAFEYSSDGKYVLLFANTAKVWRYNTRGDYWLMDLNTQKLRQVGLKLPPQSLMFAKISPDAKQVAYVSGHNIYSEDISSGIQKKLTTDGSKKMINGTFDWVYEEEFHLRDGFRWSPDSRHIAYWQLNANAIRDFYMINNTDSVYSQIIPVEYPKVGEKPSPARIGVVSLANSVTRWMKPEGDPAQHYITRMEWSGPNELIIQQLDRKQQESKLMYCNAQDGNTRTFWAENDDAWVDLSTDNPVGWNWVNKGQDFLWVSEKDGWRSIYKISRDGKNTTLLTKGDYDIAEVKSIDEANNYVYFTASPDNPLQRYLYRVKINGTQNSPELITLPSQKGTHKY
ncbi:MAG: S9 family peptidase, partial [Chitinophagaceae bacterium]